MFPIIISCVLIATVISDDAQNVVVRDVTKRSISESAIHPESLAFRLEFPQDTVILHLQRRDSLNRRSVPVYSSDEDGNVQREELDYGDSALYQSLDKRAAVTVIAKRLANGRIQRSLMGLFDMNDDGTVAIIERSDPPVADRKRDVDEKPGVTHKVTRRAITQVFDESDLDQSVKVIRREEKRAVKRGTKVRTNFVELSVIVDFSSYSAFKKDVAAITKYYNQIVNGMDIVYKTILDPKIRVSLSTFYIAKRAGDSPWTDKSPDKKADGSIDSGKVLDSLKNWIQQSGEKFGLKDHTMLFTSLDLFSPSLSAPKSNTGKAYVGAICNPPFATSVVENNGLVSTFTAIHELAHNLNANHDESGNSCKRSAGNIMGSGSLGFSTCTIQYFKDKISTLSPNCLRNKPNETAEFAAVTKLPGQIYSLTEQCQMLQGPSSELCYFGKQDLTTICKELACKTPSGSCSKSTKSIAAEGTQCGNKMWCKATECVRSKKAPPL
ncbi:A disintegrin and metalloproteinase with thrombospondin motifs like isoform X2 [Tubulanus polymorphus]|uniref:A disintegrin and metalloproteinase with thrombospondin motifs like isoform X2 n=1 Tax=Tubulanus polymorphus TaxID=672921 RepID=UPI003DA50E24